MSFIYALDATYNDSTKVYQGIAIDANDGNNGPPLADPTSSLLNLTELGTSYFNVNVNGAIYNKSGGIFNTKAEAQAAHISSAITTIVTLGYYTAGDGGGATYKLSTTVPVTVGVIKSADNKYWVLNIPQASLLQLGCKCDGVTDDTANLAAVSTYIAGGNKTIIIPAAITLFTTWNLANLSNTVIQGQTRGFDHATTIARPILRCTASGSGVGIAANNWFGVTLQNVDLDYTDNTYSGFLLDLSCTSSIWNKIEVRNVGMGHSTYTGAAYTATLVYGKNLVDASFIGCRFCRSNIGYLSKFTGDIADSATIRFYDCDFTVNTVGVYNPPKLCSFTACSFEPAWDLGSVAVVSGAGEQQQALSFFGCVFSDATVGGTWINLGDCYGLTISGGSFAGTTSGAGTTAISTGAAGQAGISITGVYFVNCSVGINFAGPTGGLLVSGNTFNLCTAEITGLNNCNTSFCVFSGNSPTVIPFNQAFPFATITTDNGLYFTNQTSDAKVAAGTLLNAPTAGNPAFWLRTNINGTAVAIPAWTA